MPFSYSLSKATGLDDGTLLAATKVAVVRSEGDRSWVLDDHGVVVQVATVDLTPLPAS